MAKANKILGFIGAIMMLVSGLIYYLDIQQIISNLGAYGLTLEDLRILGLEPNLLYVRMIMTLFWGILALVGSIMITKGEKSGNIVLLITGILAVVGMFIIIGSWTIPDYGSITFSLSGSLFFVDPFLILLGGIIGMASSSQPKKQIPSQTDHYEPSSQTEYTEKSYQTDYQTRTTEHSWVPKYCPQCGAHIRSGTKYCTNCGASINKKN
ncbi:MAG: zinc-ribbon domain-containing protein [Promethearchaeia archaeon]